VEHTETTSWDRVGIAAVILLLGALVVTAMTPLASSAGAEESIAGTRDDGVPEVVAVGDDDDDGDDGDTGTNGGTNSGSVSIGTNSGDTGTGTTRGTGVSNSVSNSRDRSANTATGTTRGTGKSNSVSNSS
jgi:hypothetical protein